MLDCNYFLYLIFAVIDQYFTPQGIEPPLFPQTFKTIAINDSFKKSYCHNKGGYVEKKILLTIVKTHRKSDVSTLLLSTINVIHSFFKEFMDPPQGHTFVNWLAGNKSSTYEYEVGKSTKSRGSVITKDQLKENRSTKLVNDSSKYTEEFNQPLDK